MLRDGTFALFLAGQYNTATKKAFVGTRKQGACAGYVSFHNMTHFGMNDFVAPSEETHQVICSHGLLPGFQSIGNLRNIEFSFALHPFFLGEHDRRSGVLSRLFVAHIKPKITRHSH